ncbi:hypothetical protein PPTG_22943 [Phytophthora nicotianae INRA-310]|uniref:Uncharacterized protein n=1 Tax=Phytophthora nicotianae (strain INRA-310) TaxID=761204 RepID=W2Q7X5_PHYN3|nr:hypothetical protein PPTG_22943 [Phytophthora nicotianae INRA-310]ETN08669.1 hypothetical protein PPTG_22943 [Phytophthora nicotianae INRA-310]
MTEAGSQNEKGDVCIHNYECDRTGKPKCTRNFQKKNACAPKEVLNAAAAP